MSTRRTLILLGAIALGVLAAFALYQYVNGLEDDIKGDAEEVQVYKAAELIPRGTGGTEATDAGLIEDSEISKEFRPETAITTLTEIEGEVALFDIAAGTPITSEMFVSQAETQVSFRRRLEQPNWVTATISVDQVSGVAGFLVPGDEVNMMIALTVENTEDAPEAAAIPPGEVAWITDNRYEMLYQKVHILAIGDTVELQPGEEPSEEQSSGGGLVTFNVPPDAAQLIATAQLSSTLYLSLVPEDYEPAPVEPPDLVIDTLPGQDANQLTPYGPDGSGDS